MSPERACIACGRKVEEYYWNGKLLVYVDNKRTNMTYDQAIANAPQDGEKR